MLYCPSLIYCYCLIATALAWSARLTVYVNVCCSPSIERWRVFVVIEQMYRMG